MIFTTQCSCIAKSYQAIIIINENLIEKKTIGHYYDDMGKREDKKQHIIESGLAVISEKGYNGTGVKEIVDSAGVPKGSFYTYFESKEDFAVEALEFAFSENERYMRELLLDGTSRQNARERLLGFFEANKQCTIDNGYKTGCIIGNLCQEMAGNSEQIREKTRCLFQRQNRILAQCIALAQDGQMINTELDADKLAEYLLNAWQGALMRTKSCHSEQAINVFIDMLPKLLR